MTQDNQMFDDPQDHVDYVFDTEEAAQAALLVGNRVWREETPEDPVPRAEIVRCRVVDNMLEPDENRPVLGRIR